MWDLSAFFTLRTGEEMDAWIDRGWLHPNCCWFDVAMFFERSVYELRAADGTSSNG